MCSQNRNVCVFSRGSRGTVSLTEGSHTSVRLLGASWRYPDVRAKGIHIRGWSIHSGHLYPREESQRTWDAQSKKMEAGKHRKPRLKAWQLPGACWYVCVRGQAEEVQGQSPESSLAFALSPCIQSSPPPYWTVLSTYMSDLHLSSTVSLTCLSSLEAAAHPERCAVPMQGSLRPSRGLNHLSDSCEWQIITAFSERYLSDSQPPPSL